MHPDMLRGPAGFYFAMHVHRPLFSGSTRSSCPCRLESQASPARLAPGARLQGQVLTQLKTCLVARPGRAKCWHPVAFPAQPLPSPRLAAPPQPHSTLSASLPLTPLIGLVNTHTHTHTITPHHHHHTQTRTHARLMDHTTHTRARARDRTHTSMHTHKHTCTYAHAQRHRHRERETHARTHTHTHTRTRTHARTHACIICSCQEGGMRERRRVANND